MGVHNRLSREAHIVPDGIKCRWLRRKIGFPGLHRMNIFRAAGAALALVACGGGDSVTAAISSEERFILCSDPPDSGHMVIIDYESGWSLNRDLLGPIESCVDRASCILRPMAFSAPPRLPEFTSDIVEWKVENYEFRMSQADEENRRFIITRTAPAVQHGNDTASEQIATFVYDESEGVISLEFENEGITMVRCHGRMTWQNLDELSSQRGPRTASPPNSLGPEFVTSK